MLSNISTEESYLTMSTATDRPTEIETYQYTVEECRALGMTDEEIARFLYVEWITGKEFARMLETLGVTPSRGHLQPS